MSQLRRSSSSANPQSDGGEEPCDEPPNKQKKSLQCVKLPVIGLPASRVGFDKIPDEVMLRIFSHLSEEELIDVTQHVCSRWRCLSHDPGLWRDKKFCIGRSCSDAQAVSELQQMPLLRALVVRRAVDSSVIEALCDNCHHLTTLEIRANQQMSFSLLNELVQKCSGIQSLSIAHHLLSSRMAQTLARLPRLQSLEVLPNPRSHSIARLRPFAYGCPELTVLKVSKDVKFLFEDLKYFFNMKCRTLTHASFPWVSHDNRCVVPLLEVCTSMSHLELDDCLVIEKDSEAFTVVGRLPSLRSLVINDLRGRRAAELLELAFTSGGLSQLQVLKIRHKCLPGSVLTAVCVHCPELKELALGGLSVYSEEGFRQFYRLSKLETLDLSECATMPENAMHYVVQLPKLRKLCVTGRRVETLERNVDSILDMTSLEVLSISDLDQQTPFPLERIPGNLINLRVLNLKQCVVDGSVVKRLRDQMPCLQVNVEHRQSDDWSTDAEDGGRDSSDTVPSDFEDLDFKVRM